MRDPNAADQRWLDEEFVPYLQGVLPVLPFDPGSRIVTVTNRRNSMAVFRAMGWATANGSVCLVQPCTDYGTDPDGQFYARFVWAVFNRQVAQYAALTVEFRPATVADMPQWGIYTRSHGVIDRWHPARTGYSDNTTRTYYDRYACFSSKEAAEASAVWADLPGEPWDKDHYIEEWKAAPVIWTANA